MQTTLLSNNPYQVCWLCPHMLVIGSVLRQVMHRSSLSQKSSCTSSELLLQLLSSQQSFLQETLTLMKLMSEWHQECVKASMTEWEAAPRWTAAALLRETYTVLACSCTSLSQATFRGLCGLMRRR